jgi:hypothetical protein
VARRHPDASSLRAWRSLFEGDVFDALRTLEIAWR